MVLGIGVDIVEVERIQKIVQSKEQAFCAKIFSEKEISCCYRFSNPYPHFAARFAAKEAFAKALGTGIGKIVTFKDLTVTRDEYGKPCLNLSLEKQHQVQKHLKLSAEQTLTIHLSLSHEKNAAIAMVLIEA